MVQCRISHWLPIVTICPVNHLPDLLYVTVSFADFMELYEIRRRIRRRIAWKVRFMELLAEDLMDEFPSATEVEVALLTRRHVVILKRG